MLLFNNMNFLALTVGVALSHAAFYPGSGRFTCSVADRLENSSCCYKLDYEALSDKCEPCMIDHSSAASYSGRLRLGLTKSVTVSVSVGRDEFYRDPCNRRHGRPAYCDLDEGARVCVRV
jgi:hypothetical protein